MDDLCEHETFRDICGICHRNKLITALRAENEKLRAALRDIAAGQVTYLPFIQTVARAALGGKDE